MAAYVCISFFITMTTTATFWVTVTFGFVKISFNYPSFFFVYLTEKNKIIIQISNHLHCDQHYDVIRIINKQVYLFFTITFKDPVHFCRIC